MQALPHLHSFYSLVICTPKRVFYCISACNTFTNTPWLMCLMYCFMLAHACNLCMYLIVDWNVIKTATILLLGAYSVVHAATYTIVQLQRVARVSGPNHCKYGTCGCKGRSKATTCGESLLKSVQYAWDAVSCPNALYAICVGCSFLSQRALYVLYTCG